MVKGLKNTYLMHFSSLPSWFHCRVCYYLQCSSSLSQRVKQRVKKLFFCQNLFQLMYNHKPKSNALIRKNHKTADRKGGEGGGGNPYGQPDHKIPVFLTASLIPGRWSWRVWYQRRQEALTENSWSRQRQQRRRLTCHWGGTQRGSLRRKKPTLKTCSCRSYGNDWFRMIHATIYI